MKLVRYVSTLLSVPFVSVVLAVIAPVVSPQGLGSLSLLQAVGLSMMFLGVLPYVPYAIQMKKGLVDFDVSDRRKRTPTYVMAMISYLVLSVAFYMYSSSFMLGFSLMYLFGTIMIAAINVFWKVSAHTAGLAGPVTYFIYFFSPLVSVFYVLVVVAAYTRLKLEMHSPFQLLAGTVITIATASLSFFLVSSL